MEDEPNSSKGTEGKARAGGREREGFGAPDSGCYAILCENPSRKCGRPDSAESVSSILRVRLKEYKFWNYFSPEIQAKAYE